MATDSGSALVLRGPSNHVFSGGVDVLSRADQVIGFWVGEGDELRIVRGVWVDNPAAKAIAIERVM